MDSRTREAYFGDCKKLLCDINDTSQLLDVVNSCLNSIRMVVSRSFQNVRDLVHLTLRPSSVCRSTIMNNCPENTKSGEHDHSFFVDDIEFVTDSPYREPSASGEDASFGDQGGTW